VRRLALVLVTLLLSLVAAPVAGAQLGPNAPAPLTQNAPPPPAPVNTNAADDGGLSTLQLVLIFGSAMAVLAAIAWIILRDAHRAAPVPERSHGPAEQKKLSARERERQQRQRRDKAKAARQQRKRNRPR
jgi:hypothetical protein